MAEKRWIKGMVLFGQPVRFDAEQIMEVAPQFEFIIERAKNTVNAMQYDKGQALDGIKCFKEDFEYALDGGLMHPDDIRRVLSTLDEMERVLPLF